MIVDSKIHASREAALDAPHDLFNENGRAASPGVKQYAAGSRRGKSLIHRDQIHGDVQYDPMSVALLDTPAFQRLGRVYQLGYAHLVFRGGTHTRLSHVMGAAHLAAKIADSLRANYARNATNRPRHIASPEHFLPRGKSDTNVGDRWDVLRHLVGWAGLLHDIAHVPLGHTLEDEFDGILKKHDDFASPRALTLWDRGREIYRILTDVSLYPPSFLNCGIAKEQVWQTVLLICFYKDELKGDSDEHVTFDEILAQRADAIENTNSKQINAEVAAPKEGQQALETGATQGQSENASRELKFIRLLQQAREKTRGIFSPYMTDIVGNTICADYLDYLRRDPTNVGLDVLRDERVLSNFYVSGGNARGEPHRMALALIDRNGKPSLAVCTGVVELVRQRYRFAELIYYHKTKVSASAMFAKAMGLIGTPPEIGGDQRLLYRRGVDIPALARALVESKEDFRQLKADCLPSALLHPEIGDDSLHLALMQKAFDQIEDELYRDQSRAENEGTKATRIEECLRGIALLQAISRRKIYKVCVSINSEQFGRLVPGSEQKEEVERRLRRSLDKLRKDKGLRDRLEREMARAADWATDSILLYVPPRKSQAKGIETFAFDRHGVVRLGKHPAVSAKVNELSQDYQNLWRLLVLVHPDRRNDAINLSNATDVLVEQLRSGFGDSETSGAIHDHADIAAIKEAAWFTYIPLEHRAAAERLRDLYTDARGNITHLINWDRFERLPVHTTKGHVSLQPEDYAERNYLIEQLLDELQTSDNSIEQAEEKAVALLREKFPQAGEVMNYSPPSNIKAYHYEGGSLSDAQEKIFKRAHELDYLVKRLLS